MSELTKTMQPVCVGRFNIEIPTVANIDSWRQEVNYIEIKSISPPSPNRNVFEAKIRLLETKLKTSPHDLNGVLLKNKTQLNPDSVLFVYRESRNIKTRFKLEGLYWAWR